MSGDVGFSVPNPQKSREHWHKLVILEDQPHKCKEDREARWAGRQEIVGEGEGETVTKLSRIPFPQTSKFIMRFWL